MSNKVTIVRRDCLDCPRSWNCKTSSKIFVCPVCRAIELDAGVTSRQPADPSVYQPRFDGTQHFEEEK